jgi:hypothetical protein
MSNSDNKIVEIVLNSFFEKNLNQQLLYKTILDWLQAYFGEKYEVYIFNDYCYQWDYEKNDDEGDDTQVHVKCSLSVKNLKTNNSMRLFESVILVDDGGILIHFYQLNNIYNEDVGKTLWIYNEEQLEKELFNYVHQKFPYIVGKTLIEYTEEITA